MPTPPPLPPAKLDHFELLDTPGKLGYLRRSLSSANARLVLVETEVRGCRSAIQEDRALADSWRKQTSEMLDRQHEQGRRIDALWSRVGRLSALGVLVATVAQAIRWGLGL